MGRVWKLCGGESGSNGVRDGGGLAYPWSIVEKRTGLDQPGNLGEAASGGGMFTWHQVCIVFSSIYFEICKIP